MFKTCLKRFLTSKVFYIAGEFLVNNWKSAGYSIIVTGAVDGIGWQGVNASLNVNLIRLESGLCWVNVKIISL